MCISYLLPQIILHNKSPQNSGLKTNHLLRLTSLQDDWVVIFAVPMHTFMVKCRSSWQLCWFWLGFLCLGVGWLSADHWLAWACSYGRCKVPRDRTEAPTSLEAKTWNCRTVTLPHSTGQSESQGQPRFKGWGTDTVCLEKGTGQRHRLKSEDTWRGEELGASLQ